MGSEAKCRNCDPARVLEYRQAPGRLGDGEHWECPACSCYYEPWEVDDLREIARLRAALEWFKAKLGNARNGEPDSAFTDLQRVYLEGVDVARRALDGKEEA